MAWGGERSVNKRLVHKTKNRASDRMVRGFARNVAPHKKNVQPSPNQASGRSTAQLVRIA
jgi:hypothetical protein